MAPRQPSPSRAATAPGTTAAYGAPAATGGPAEAASVPRRWPGTALVDGAGRALYLFEADNGTTSNCNGQCAQVWPPLLVGGMEPSPSGDVHATLLGTTTRADGAKQVIYNGHPLYYFMGDKAPGDARGQGINRFGGGWYVVDPAGNKIDPDDPPAPAPAAGNSGYGY